MVWQMPSLASVLALPASGTGPRLPEGPFLILVAFAPNPADAEWMKISVAVDIEVSNYAGSLSEDQCQKVKEHVAQSGQLPQLDDMTLHQSKKAFRNTKLTLLRPGCGLYLVDGCKVELVDTSQSLIQDVMDVFHLVQKHRVSRLCVLTQSPAPTRVAKVIGSCRGCLPGQGFLHVPAGRTNILRALQCHACGLAFVPEAIQIAGYTWEMQLDILNAADGDLQDHRVDVQQATNDVTNPDCHRIDREPEDSIRDFMMSLHPNSIALAHVQVANVDSCQISRGVMLRDGQQFGNAGGEVVLGRPPCEK